MLGTDGRTVTGQRDRDKCSTGLGAVRLYSTMVLHALQSQKDLDQPWAVPLTQTPGATSPAWASVSLGGSEDEGRYTVAQSRAGLGLRPVFQSRRLPMLPQ